MPWTAPEVKTVEYDWNSSRHEVAYIIFNNEVCVFTYSKEVEARKPKYYGCTMRSVGVVIKAICEKECLKQNELDFFDLQTKRGKHLTKCGYVLYYIEPRPTTFIWIPVKCPLVVQKIFERFIN